MTHKNCKVGQVKVEGRTFQIQFWNDAQFNLPWVEVSEIVIKPVRLHWFSHKTKMSEVKQIIDSGWTENNRLDWAMSRIAKYLKQERDSIEELRQIEDFCRMKD